jgi:hypothetical protein
MITNALTNCLQLNLENWKGKKLQLNNSRNKIAIVDIPTLLLSENFPNDVQLKKTINAYISMKNPSVSWPRIGPIFI